MQRVQPIVDDLVRKFRSEIISVIEFGSAEGELNPELSDVDILIVCKDIARAKEIMALVRNDEKGIFHTVHSNFSNFLERHFLGSNELGGIHAVILSHGEFTRHLGLKSFRLKILTAVLISKSVFLYNLKYRSRLLYGNDLAEDIVVPDVSLFDRVRAFALPVLVLVFVPFCLDRVKFIMWCCKSVKYLEDYMKTYFMISSITGYVPGKNLVSLMSYRYNPEKYKGSRARLYWDSWVLLIRNLGFLLPGTKFVS